MEIHISVMEKQTYFYNRNTYMELHISMLLTHISIMEILDAISISFIYKFAIIPNFN